GGEQEPRRRAQALENRDRVALPRHERSDGRRDTDSADQQARHPDETEVARELTVEAAPAGPALLERAHTNRWIGDDAGELSSNGVAVKLAGQPRQAGVVPSAAERDQAGAVERWSSHEQARAQRDDPARAVGLVLDHAANDELRVSHEHGVADPHAEAYQRGL